MELFNSYTDRLRAINWGAAAEWSPVAPEMILEYYRRCLPHWPAERVYILPHNAKLIDPYRSDYVDYVTRWLLDYHLYDRPISAIAKAMIPLILGCGFDDIPRNESPAEPILEFFEAGFDLSLNHNALDIVYAQGLVTMKLPARAAMINRAPARIEIRD